MKMMKTEKLVFCVLMFFSILFFGILVFFPKPIDIEMFTLLQIVGALVVLLAILGMYIDLRKTSNGEQENAFQDQHITFTGFWNRAVYLLLVFLKKCFRKNE